MSTQPGPANPMNMLPSFFRLKKALQRLPAIRALIQINVRPPLGRTVVGRNVRLHKEDG